jgi:FkbM family methyltransferase
MSNDIFIDQLFVALTDLRGEMRVSRASYQVMKKLLIDYFRASAFASESGGQMNFGPFGSLQLGYHRMGAIDSVDLFGIDELLVFAYYYANRNRYRKTLDLGANLGLHSIIMSRCGYEVTAFEPDPIHQEWLLTNLASNNITNVKLERAAVSDRDGEAEFVRVVGNTTGSHLAGAKASPYGELNRFAVKVRDIPSMRSWRSAPRPTQKVFSLTAKLEASTFSRRRQAGKKSFRSTTFLKAIMRAASSSATGSIFLGAELHSAQNGPLNQSPGTSCGYLRASAREANSASRPTSAAIASATCSARTW